MRIHFWVLVVGSLVFAFALFQMLDDPVRTVALSGMPNQTNYLWAQGKATVMLGKILAAFGYYAGFLCVVIGHASLKKRSSERSAGGDAGKSGSDLQ